MHSSNHQDGVLEESQGACDVPDELIAKCNSVIVATIDVMAKKRKPNFRPSNPNSVFGKAFKAIFKHPSTLAKRVYICNLWNATKNGRKGKTPKSKRKLYLRKYYRTSGKENRKRTIQEPTFNNQSKRQRLHANFEVYLEQSGDTQASESGTENQMGSHSDSVGVDQSTPAAEEENPTETGLLEEYLMQYQEKCNNYPTYPCPVCRRGVYHMEGYTRNYTFTEAVIRKMHSLGFDDFEVGSKVHICRRCADNLSKKKIPSMCYMNKLDQPDVPDCIGKLNDLEIRFISQIKLFMKIHHLCKGRGQLSLKGSCIHFPQSVDEIIEKLPLNPSTIDIVIVNETNESGETIQEFQVRRKELYDALIYLKANNHLYSNVEVQSSSDQNFGIQEIRVGANPNSSSIRERVLSQPSEGYKSISNHVRILRATIHQASFDVFPAGGNQCAAMSACAVAHAFIHPINTWTSHDLDNLLFAGDQYYGIVLPGRDRFLETTEVAGVIECFRAVQVRVCASEDIWFGMLNKIAGTEYNRLPTAMSEFLASDFNYAVLTASEFCMAIVKCNNIVYLFHSHSRGPKGRTSANGTACVVGFDMDAAVNSISELVHRNCQPKARVGKQPQMEQLQHFQFMLHPMLCSYVDNPDDHAVNPEAEMNDTDEQCHPIEENMAVEDSQCNKHSIYVQALANPNNMMLDCVIRNDDQTEPTVDQFKEALKQNTDVIPPVRLCRERGRPMYPEKENRLEELAFVKAFPTGINGLCEERKLKITPLDYFQQRVMSLNPVFHNNEYLFYALNRVECHTLNQKIAICGNMAANNGNQIDEDYLPGLENVHLYMQAIRGTSSYWRKYTNDVLAMIEQLGVPTFFLTISHDDLNSVDSLSALWKAKYGSNAELPADPSSIPYETRRDLLNNYPVAAARHFNLKANIIFNLIKKQGKFLFGADVVDYTYRIEFQGRGSPHIPALIWTNVTVKYDSAEGVEFIEKNISCSTDVTFKDLVMRYQNHAHKNTCFKKHNLCRFGFPRKPSDITKVLDEEEIAKNHGRFVELKRSIDEVMINNYHPKLLQILKCNMDIQLVTGCRAIAYYVGKYMSKGEPTYLREEIQNIMTNFKTATRSSYYEKAKKIASTILKHREVSAQEAAWRLCHLPLRYSTRMSVFIPSFQPQNRIRMVRKDTVFSDDPKVGMNIIDRYIHRPEVLAHLCLLEFAAWWKPAKNTALEDPDEDLVEGDLDDGIEDIVQSLSLLNNKGRIQRRRVHAIVRYPKFKPLERTDDYLYSMMLLHLPFRSEDFVEGYETIKDAFTNLSPHFRRHEDDPIINPELADQVNAVFEDLEEQEQEGENAVGNNENERYGAFYEEPVEQLNENELFQPLNFEADEIQMEDKLRSMTNEQREVFNRVKSALRGNNRQNMLEYVAGTAGVGKSFLITCIDYIIKSRHPSKERALIKAAPTGVASRNIEGVTLHKAFSLGVEQHGIAQYMKLGGRTLHDKRMMFRYVDWILIDEVSMVSYQVLRMISLRLCEIFDTDLPFGRKNLILFGDLLQLKPVRGNWVFDQPSYLSHEVNLWKLFQFSELTIVLRQSGIDPIANILARLRLGILTDSDIEILETRLLDDSKENFNGMLILLHESLHLYPKVKQVEKYNEDRLNNLEETGSRIYKINARDSFGSGLKFGQPAPVDLIFTDIRKCAGIPTTLSMCIGCKVMLKWNVDPLGGLCNGSVGIVRGFRWTGLRREQLEEGDLPEAVFVEFDGRVDPKHLSSVDGFQMCVEVRPKTFEFIGKRGTRIHRHQLPLVLSFAVSIHKAQGLSLDACSVHLGKELFTYGLAYVATSRVRSFGGLCITDLSRKHLIVNCKGNGPCNPVPLKELYRLKILKLLEVGEDFEPEFINDLVSWTIEYVFCPECGYWKCICTCNM